MIMKIKNYMAVIAAGSFLFFCGGCANHLRNIDTVTQESERSVLNVKYELKFAPEVLRDASYHVEIRKMESAEVKKYEVRAVKSIVTPYQWWREFYEIPAGLGLLPVSLGSHMLFLCSLGIFPYDIPKAINEMAFTGLNPGLNWENDARQEDIPVSFERKMLSQTAEHTQTPLVRQAVTVTSGNLKKVFITDDFGGFDLNFLALQEKDMFFPLARKVSFSLENSSTELKRLILTREFLSKLMWARTRINAYKMNPTGKNLFDTVIYLEKNGFELLAYSLEESELARQKEDKAFQGDFSSAASRL